MNQVLRSVLRTNFLAFIEKCFEELRPGEVFLPNWHIQCLAYELEQCIAGKIKRLLILAPPRSLKSYIVSVALPAWLLGHFPDKRIIGASYGNDLSFQLSRETRRIMESAWYRATFPKTQLDPRRNTEAEFATTANGSRMATSIGGTFTGRGGDWLILDDMLKAADAFSVAARKAVIDWFRNTALSRLDNKNEGVIIAVMQRLHQDDLAGHLLTLGGWRVLCFPAIATERCRYRIGPGKHDWYTRRIGEPLHAERETLDTLRGLEQSMKSYVFQAQYQQAPLPAQGNLIKRNWLRHYKDYPAFDTVIQSWDTASTLSETADWSVCTTWGIVGRTFYLTHVDRQRLEAPELQQRIVSNANRHGAAAVLIEADGFGRGLCQNLRRQSSFHVVPIPPRNDKLARLAAQADTIETGAVLFPDEAPWLDEFLSEVLAFPSGSHDDQVDSMSQFLTWAASRRYFPTRGPRDRRDPPRAEGQYIPTLSRPRVSLFSGDPIQDLTDWTSGSSRLF